MKLLKIKKPKPKNLAGNMISGLEAGNAQAEKKSGENGEQEPWWVIALKVAAYLIGLLLAGMGTVEAATLMM